jgi:hypothetical protein
VGSVRCQLTEPRVDGALIAFAREEMLAPLGPRLTPFRIARSAPHSPTTPPGARPTDDHPIKPAALLYATKLLPPKEAKQLHDYWRARYEQAYEHGEDFAYCCGPDEWLYGDAAGRAHFRQYGILPALVEQWEAERKQPPPAA